MKIQEGHRLKQKGGRKSIYDIVFPKFKRGDYIVKKVLENATYGMRYFNTN